MKRKILSVLILSFIISLAGCSYSSKGIDSSALYRIRIEVQELDSYAMRYAATGLNKFSDYYSSTISTGIIEKMIGELKEANLTSDEEQKLDKLVTDITDLETLMQSAIDAKDNGEDDKAVELLTSEDYESIMDAIRSDISELMGSEN